MGRRGLSWIVIALAVAAPAQAASLPAGTTAVLSGAPSLLAALPAPVSSSTSEREAISQTGGFVAFASTSDGLSAEDDDTIANIYVRNVSTGAVTLVSRRSGSDGAPADADCEDPAISDDATRVAFTCRGPLVSADVNGGDDVYVRDVVTQTTFLVSRKDGLGEVGNGPSESPSLSETGTYVAFESEATNLLATPTESDRVYRRRIGDGDGVVLMSRQPAALGGEGRAGAAPSISDTGNRVAFQSEAPDLSATADGNGDTDVYVRDHAADSTVLASRVDGAGAVGNGSSRTPALSGSGEAVAFASDATNLDAVNDPATDLNIYRRELDGTAASQTTVLVDITAGGQKGTIAAFGPSIDDSGNTVGWVTLSDALDPADPIAVGDAYVKNLNTNVLRVVSRADGDAGAVLNTGAGRISVSGDGGKAAFSVEYGRGLDGEETVPVVALRNYSSTPQRTTVVSQAGGPAVRNEGGDSGGGAMSYDGRFAVMVTGAPALLPPGVVRGIVVRDRVTGSVTLASRADGPNGAPFAGSVFHPAISGDGRRVAFVASDHLDPDVSPNRLWVRDLPSGRTFLASVNDAGVEANGYASTPVLDADGSRVAFSTDATNLGAGDTDADTDVHLRDLDAARTLLVSRADGAAGAKGNQFSDSAAIDAAGARVAFLTASSNLGDGDTDVVTDVHVRDVDAGTTRLVTTNPDGTKASAASGHPSIDASGTRIAFDSGAPNLGGFAGNDEKVFVRDLAANTLTLASRLDGPDGALPDGDAEDGHISPDGGYVAFSSAAANLGATSTRNDLVFRRDLAGGRTELVSRGTGAGAQASGFNQVAGISAGGTCVTFVSFDPLLGGSGDFEQVYLRAFAADCTAPVPPVAVVPPPGGGVVAPGRPAARDTVAPVLRGAKLSRKRFRVARAATALRAATGRGTVLTFRSSEAATLTLLVERRVPGRRVRRGRRTVCTPVARRPRRGRCTAFKRAGTITRRIRAGNGRVALSGRLGRKAMARGTYRLTLTARDAAGNRSRPVVLAFTIVKR